VLIAVELSVFHAAVAQKMASASAQLTSSLRSQDPLSPVQTVLLAGIVLSQKPLVNLNANLVISSLSNILRKLNLHLRKGSVRVKTTLSTLR